MVRKGVRVLVAAFLAAGCRSAPAQRESTATAGAEADRRGPEGAAAVDNSRETAKGLGFRITLPIGWRIDDGTAGRMLQEKGGVILLAPQEDPSIKTNLVVVPLPHKPEEFVVSTDAQCADLGKQLDSAGQLVFEGSRMVELPIGLSCEIDGAEPGDASTVATATLISTTSHQYLLSCTRPRADDVTPEVCRAMVRSFAAEP